MAPARVLLTCLGFILVHVAAFAGEAPGYSIQFARKSFVGERYAVTARGLEENTTNTRRNATIAPPQHKLRQVEFVATAEVLALTPLGLEAKSRYLVEKLVGTQDGKETSLLPAGSVLTAERKRDKMEYLVNGKAVKGEVANALSLCGLTLDADGVVRDDQIFGSTERKQPGDIWPINGAAAAPVMKKMGLSVAPKDLTGDTRLVDIVKQNGQDVLRVGGRLILKNLDLPLPAGVIVQSSDIKATFSGVLPVDPDKRIIYSALVAEAEIECDGNVNGSYLALQMNLRRAQSVSFEPR